MNAQEHKAEAEQILTALEATSEALKGERVTTAVASNMNEIFRNQIAIAQVHATLATIPNAWTA